MARHKRKICIVGAGFAGLEAARQLSPREFSVTLFDPQPHLEWLPNIHELLSGRKQAEDLQMPRAPLIARMGHQWCPHTVTRIEPDLLVLDTGETLAFDACIVAVGGIHDSHGVAGAQQYGLPFKSVAQCQAIAERLSELSRQNRPHLTKACVSIIGGGIEGIEALGEILRAYPHDFQVQVVDSAPRLLKTGPVTLDASVRQHCRHRPVSFHFGQRVSQVTADTVTLENGETLTSHATIWTGGVAPPPLLRDSGLADSETGWGPVNACLQSQYHNIFIVGDAAQHASPLAKQAFHALDMGRNAGRNAARLLTGKTLRPYRPIPKPQLVTFGDIDTYMLLGDQAVGSPLLGVAKEGIFTLGLLQFSVQDSRAALKHQLGALRRSIDTAYRPSLQMQHLLQGLSQSRWLPPR